MAVSRRSPERCRIQGSTFFKYRNLKSPHKIIKSRLSREGCIDAKKENNNAITSIQCREQLK